MKTVNFIEAIKYAKKGKEVYIKILEDKYYLYILKKTIGKEVFILSEDFYELAKTGCIFPNYDALNNIEFYLNKWIVKDEEEKEGYKPFPWKPDEIKLNK